MTREQVWTVTGDTGEGSLLNIGMQFDRGTYYWIILWDSQHLILLTSAGRRASHGSKTDAILTDGWDDG